MPTSPLPLSSSDDDDVVYLGVVKRATGAAYIVNKKTSAQRPIDTSRAKKKGRIVPASTSARVAQHDPPEIIDYTENTGFFKGRKSFCLLLYVDPDHTLQKFIASCKDLSSSEFNKCLQFAGTEHFTMFNRKNLTYSEAMSIMYKHPKRDDTNMFSLPNMNLVGFTAWGKDGVFLATNTSISHLAARIIASFTWRIQNNLHLSLYRRRGVVGKGFAEAQARTIKNKLRHKSKGSARGTVIVLKEMGKDYFGRDGSFFRVIYK